MRSVVGVVTIVAWVGCSPEIDLRGGQELQPEAVDLLLTEVVDAGSVRTDSLDAEITPWIDAGQTSPPCYGPPGLYRTGSCTQLAEGVREYRPRYERWTDGADKFRFIYLPAGQQIDVTNVDRWIFPVGTRLYLTFVDRGAKLETRMLEKTSPGAGIGNWAFRAFVWNSDQLGVTHAPEGGVSNVLGSGHDVPSQEQCVTCHDQPGLDAVNGFGALQLNHDNAGFTHTELLNRQLLATASAQGLPTAEDARFPGDSRAQNALGYLHANCGNCHGGSNPRAGLKLWTTVATTEVINAPIFAGGDTCACLSLWRYRFNAKGQEYTRRIVPGHAEISGIIGRMSVRAPVEQMPPLGTKEVDQAGLITVSNWINSLDLGCDPTVVCRQPPPVRIGTMPPTSFNR